MATKNTESSLNFDELADGALVTMDTAASVLAVSRRTMYRLHVAGKLPIVPIGGSSRVRVSDLRRMVAGG
jgi:excisionase family DNA binding protein